MSNRRDQIDEYGVGDEVQLMPSRVHRELYAASASSAAYSDPDRGFDTYSDNYSSPGDDERAAAAVADSMRVNKRRRRDQQGSSSSGAAARRLRTVAPNDMRVERIRSRGGERSNLSRLEAEPFMANSISPSYDDDPARKLKSTRDFFMKRILFEDYPFKYLIVADIVSICMYLSFAIVSGLVAATGADEINTYIYLIIGTVTNGLITLGAHLPMSVYYWMKRKQHGLTHQHLISTTLPLIVSIPIMIFGWFGLGRWISSFGSCCGLDENQPNPANAEEYNNFVWAHASLAVASLIALMYFPFSIWAHLYPEVDVEMHDQFIHVRDVNDTENDRDQN
jgi:hypothetical protein